MDPVSLTVIGGLAAVELTRLFAASIRRRRRDPERRNAKVVKKTLRKVRKTIRDFNDDVEDSGYE
jgi:hypothetical protein